jgi:hypothetical protein
MGNLGHAWFQEMSRLQYGRVALFRPWYGTPLRQNEYDHWE